VDHKLSHGIGDQTGTRNAPVLINLAWSRHFMWDGSIRNLDEQAKVPICNPLEMNESISHVVNKLRQSKQYPGLFRSAFGDSAINETMILKSLSQFMLTLVSANAKYDRVMRHDEQFTEGEQKGYALFRSHCTACHTEPLFTHGGFENNGLMVDDELQDYGLMRITGKSTDSLRFKVPTLRNIEFSFPYMHDGRFKTLGQVLNNYMMGVQHGPTLSRHLQKGIYFTANQKADLIAFLLTLSDREFLFNPELGFPKK
jgi:cytochrome c peroxidase